MTKAELIARVAKNSNATKVQVESVLHSILATIQTEVASGRPVTLKGFGTFKPQARGARQGRNPATGESVAIPARTVPKFKPGSEFRNLVNKG